MSREKKKYLDTKNNKEFKAKFKSLLGKSFSEDEYLELMTKDEKNFKKEITNKFLEKRNERNNLVGEKQSNEIEKRILLQTIDVNWKLHIQYLEQLRQVIGLRSYGQRDPLIEYKKEAFSLFENLLNKLKLNLITVLLNLTIIEKPVETKKAEPIKINPNYHGKKMSRNEPCFCGSKKKYKHCCGRF